MILSSGFSELIEPVLEREGVSLEVHPGEVVALGLGHGPLRPELADVSHPDVEDDRDVWRSDGGEVGEVPDAASTHLGDEEPCRRRHAAYG